MAMSRAEIVKRSEEKHGIKAKTFKLHKDLIADIEQLAQQHNLPQNKLIALAIEKIKREGL
jgi:predicted DNA-binding ribbon-helix-helix protein